MKTILKFSLYACLAFSLMKPNILIGQNSFAYNNNDHTKVKKHPFTNDETAIQTTIAHFLTLAGQDEFKAMEKMMTRDISYKIDFSDENLALVKSDAISSIYGVPILHDTDYFTLKKENDSWEIVNTSFTSIPFNSEKNNEVTMSFAKGYAQAWCSQKPELVALFFTEDGSLTINNGKSSIGRVAIAKDAKSFMDAFPDMVVSMDSLINTSKGVEFHWTLTGTNTGPNGSVNKVKISGFELWRMDDNGLIKESKESFDVADYTKQLAEEKKK